VLGLVACQETSLVQYVIDLASGHHVVFHLTPVLPCPAPAPLPPPGAYDLRLASSLVRFSQPANLLGLPALTLPAGRLPGGALPQMPAGLQLIGRHWQEATLLQVRPAASAGRVMCIDMCDCMLYLLSYVALCVHACLCMCVSSLHQP
jgi:hypothetical protein